MKWDMAAIRGALGVDVGWLADSFASEVIRRFLFYRRSPHEAFPGGYERQPYFWTEIVPALDGIFGISL